MLSWLFKKRGSRAAAAASAATVAAAPPSAAQREQTRADARAAQVDAARAEWGPRLAAAQGDDAALLQLALTAPLPDIRLAAVEAIAGEDPLRQAEREFRSRDRRVHSSAKRRLDAVVGQREARARAQVLIANAQGLIGQVPLPVNHLVALDRDWQALAAADLEPAQRTQFASLRGQIDAAIQARDLQQQAQQRWTVEAGRVLAALQAELQAASNQPADQGQALAPSAAHAAAQALRETCPDGAACVTLDQGLALAMQSASAVAARLQWFAAQAEAEALRLVADAAPAEPAALPAAADLAEPADGATPHVAVPVSLPVSLPVAALPATKPTSATSIDGWRTLPPLPDAALARLMDQRFEQWLRQQAAAVLPRADKPVVVKPPKPAPVRPARSRSPNADEQQQLGALLAQAEASLADGQLGGLAQQLAAFDAALDAMGATLHAGDALLGRHQVLLAERARLKGWQQWGGGQAREGLVVEAEALARLTLAAADPQATDAPALQLKPHADAIQDMRKRWRELDRLGAAAPQALWQRFDAGLQTAYQPVAAKQAVLKAARQDNLAAREALLAALDAVPGPGEVAALAALATPSDEAGSAPGNDSGSDPTTPWKEPLRALDRFHTAWRQLGPLEHTVPAAAREALLQRLHSSLDRIEGPLQQARQVAEAVREQMIAHAQSLLAGPDHPAPPHDAVQLARALQFDWQQHARSLPLARGIENALWTRFKTTIDAVYGQREAAFRARDAELDSQLAEREAVVQRLVALAGDSGPAAERERSLAEIDRAWRQPAELPRGAAEALEARYRAARASVVQGLAAIARQQWLAQCDALAQQLDLCAQREQAGDVEASVDVDVDVDVDAGAGAGAGAGADQAGRWAAQPALPGVWGAALAQRWASPVAAGPLPEAEVDALLLLLEAALDLPATADQQAARQQLKLLAMKDKFEGRASTRPAALPPADALLALLRQRGATSVQHGRLLGLVAALGRGTAGGLGSPVARP